jgi:cobyrinic acid a,c-diamide synthase
MAIVIAGERSGVGKTTIALALLAALRQRGDAVQAFKVGPDYIDPMFHRALTGRPAYNLDPVLTSETYVQRCYQTQVADVEQAVVEGVMGLFDGAGGGDFASTAHIARLLNLPVVLVVDCGRLSRSLAAILHGYCTFDPQVQIAGVVLNRVGSDRHRAMLQAAIAPLQIPILGIFPRDRDLTLPDRHLGLVPTDELPDLARRFDHLATLGQRCFDWDALSPLLAVRGAEGQGSGGAACPVRVAAPKEQRSRRLCRPEGARRERGSKTLSTPGLPSSSSLGRQAGVIAAPVRIGVARDRAFNFYYADNLAALERAGAECIPFSPLTDSAPPPDLDGLYLGGGFPEMFAAALADNVGMKKALAEQLAAGLPAIAECGGLMYLGRSLTDFDGQTWPMVGALPLDTAMTGRLSLGYRQVTALQPSSPLLSAGATLWGHEFHRSALTSSVAQPLYETEPYPVEGAVLPQASQEGICQGNIHASYVHLHWGDRPELPTRFIAHCRIEH